VGWEVLEVSREGGSARERKCIGISDFGEITHQPRNDVLDFRHQKIRIKQRDGKKGGGEKKRKGRKATGRRGKLAGEERKSQRSFIAKRAALTVAGL